MGIYRLIYTGKFFQAEDGIRDRSPSRGLGDVYKRQVFHYVLGGSKFNTLGAGVTVDDDGRILYGTMYGKVRILR